MSTSHAPAEQSPAQTFDDFDLHPAVMAAVKAVGYESPSPIQARTIPPLLEGRDVVGLAQTGTGKTAAFALPVVSRLAAAGETGSQPDGPAVLVLTPTRELALQVAEAFSKYASELPGFSILPIYGGQSYGPQLAGLRRGAPVVVGTPGRVIDHLKKGSLKLENLKNLVLDEADEMLKMGFADDIEEIFNAAGSQRQVALFSATMPSSIARIAGKYLDDPVNIRVEASTTTGANIRQRQLLVNHAHKLDALTRILEIEEYDGIILFVRTKQATEELAEKLRARGLSAAAINGDIPQQARERTVDQLKAGGIDILVATDVAARGLDVERIQLVVNYDIPHDTESYVHRIGRTGRAGRSGEAILFVTPRERHLLRAIEKATGQRVETLKLPTVEELTSSRVQRFSDRITQARSTADLAEFRQVIERYEEQHDVPATEVAAALASLLLDGASLKAAPLPEPAGANGSRRESGGVREHRRKDGMTTYRIALGRHQRLQPGAVVGAIANEGGISSAKIGHIDIRSDHTLVDLPSDLDQGVLNKLAGTRIGGKPIDLRPDTGRPGRPERKPHRHGAKPAGDRRGDAKGKPRDFKPRKQRREF